MRLAAFLSTTLIATGLAVTAAAAPLGDVATINITIGDELQDKADDYGAKEFAVLAADLRESLERELARTGQLAPGGGALDLVIEDARPNRPTMRQMVNRPGLSFESRGVGGAEITGTYTAPDGTRVPVGYSWWESDFQTTWAASTWSDAETTFDRFARRLTRGQTVARR